MGAIQRKRASVDAVAKGNDLANVWVGWSRPHFPSRRPLAVKPLSIRAEAVQSALSDYRVIIYAMGYSRCKIKIC